MKYGLAGKKEATRFADGLRYSEAGLVPVAVTDAATNKLLMLAYANKEAVQRTLLLGEAWFFSRSRDSFWKKGETSGNTMRVLSVAADCDNDALQYFVQVQGAGTACHTGRKGCFVQKFGKRDKEFTIAALDATIASRIAEGKKGSYTVKLARSQKLAIAKLREESEELVEALEKKGRNEIIWEACDLLYHTLVAVRAKGVALSDLERELGRRSR